MADTFHFPDYPRRSTIQNLSSLLFLPAAKPSGPRTVRVVVVVGEGGEQFNDLLRDL